MEAPLDESSRPTSGLLARDYFRVARYPGVFTICSHKSPRRSHLAVIRNPRRANRAVPGQDIAS